MLSRRCRSVIASTSYRLAVVLAAVAYLVVAIGFPVPARSVKASGVEGQCAAGACGCDEVAKRLHTCCCCNSAGAVAAEPSCCSGTEEPSEAEEAPVVRWVIGLHQQECRGLATLWVFTGATLPPPPRVLLAQDRAPTGQVAILPLCFPAVTDSPAVPPPRA
jgi:hypothetical protein